MDDKKKTDLTGLNTSAYEPEAQKKDAEYDLLTALLETAEFKNSEDAITEIDIKRNGRYMFTLHLHPISDADTRRIRKKATTYMPNPNNRKLPPVEKEFNSAKFNSLLIYTASTDEDRKKVWGNRQLMDKLDVTEPWETVDHLLLFGEKMDICDRIMESSGMGEDEESASPEEYVKN
ncbi:phage tail assembly chaperone [Emergencia timonensis]|uniref:phage tail assembly chaperone n=1 Tax=Emergencia timonensis TaxID=1776384 RepID=UPI00241E2B57|nr:hypothetical protein [Emergencia timonensis]